MVLCLKWHSPRSRLIAIVLAIVLTPALGLGGYLAGLQLVGNIHTVEPNVVYRSAQLEGSRLESVIEQYDIKSIISLVSSAPDRSWYRDELAVSKAKNVKRYELPLSASEELTSDQLQKLLLMLQNAPKPVLIHCKNGADRSGLAAAIFKYALLSRPAGEAENQLSLRYGHFPYFWSGTRAMDSSFGRFVREHPRSSLNPTVVSRSPELFRGPPQTQPTVSSSLRFTK